MARLSAENFRTPGTSTNNPFFKKFKRSKSEAAASSGSDNQRPKSTWIFKKVRAYLRDRLSLSRIWANRTSRAKQENTMPAEQGKDAGGEETEITQGGEEDANQVNNNQQGPARVAEAKDSWQLYLESLDEYEALVPLPQNQVRTGDGEPVAGEGAAVEEADNGGGSAEPVAREEAALVEESRSINLEGSDDPVVREEAAVIDNAHEDNHHNTGRGQDQVSSSIAINTTITIAQALQDASVSAVNEVHHRPESRPEVVKVGPVYIYNPRVALYGQLAIFIAYFGFLFPAALAGPIAFIVIVWKTGVVLGMYEVATRLLGWKDEAAPDLLLEPLNLAMEELVKMGRNGITMLDLFLGPIFGAAHREALAEDEASDTE